jgi:beta-phosphoglucomutase-like phosphatase (HAD superfamily)
MIDTILFWQDGVITTSLAEVTISQLESASGSVMETRARVEIRDRALDLQRGRIDGSAFCQRALELTQAPLDEQELAAQIQRSVKPVPGVLEVVKELEGKYGLWLMAHCPRTWLLPIAERLDMLHLFPGESILICPELGLGRLLPDVFYLAAQRAAKPIEACLLVAPQSAITTAAVNIGLNSIIFTDAYRMRRELGLRKLLPPL